MIDMTVTVQHLNQLLEERQAQLYDQVHPASHVHFESFTEVAIDGQAYQLTRSAQRLFAQKLKVPIEYLLRCPEDLQEVNLNYWVESLAETPLFVRFEREQVRAVFSLRYKPIDHVEIAERLKQSFPADKKVRFSLSDELLLIKLIDVLENFKNDQDEFSPGVAIVNSETGFSAFSKWRI
jgi:hypothetical protein